MFWFKLRGMEHRVKWQRLCVLNYIIHNIIVCKIEFSSEMLKTPWCPDSQEMKTNWWLWCGKRKGVHIEHTSLHTMTHRLCSVKMLFTGVIQQHCCHCCDHAGCFNFFSPPNLPKIIDQQKAIISCCTKSRIPQCAEINIIVHKLLSAVAKVFCGLILAESALSLCCSCKCSLGWKCVCKCAVLD